MQASLLTPAALLARIVAATHPGSHRCGRAASPFPAATQPNQALWESGGVASMRPDTARTNERLQIAPRRRGLWPMGRATCPRRLRLPPFSATPPKCGCGVEWPILSSDWLPGLEGRRKMGRSYSEGVGLVAACGLSGRLLVYLLLSATSPFCT